VTGGPRNVAHSVRYRLMKHARATGADYNSVLFRYVNERFLYRVGQRGAIQDQGK